jgi:hypothetical protein
MLFSFVSPSLSFSNGAAADKNPKETSEFVEYDKTKRSQSSTSAFGFFLSKRAVKKLPNFFAFIFFFESDIENACFESIINSVVTAEKSLEDLPDKEFSPKIVRFLFEKISSIQGSNAFLSSKVEE